eukprot:13211236-Alexandrium_andersonii.AAC.1
MSCALRAILPRVVFTHMCRAVRSCTCVHARCLGVTALIVYRSRLGSGSGRLGLRCARRDQRQRCGP